jgi:tetratricopeptide (TPR) repeat protein
MQRPALLISLFILTLNLNAQFSQQAIDLTERGIKHYESGSFELALEKLTKAIEITSKPQVSSKVRRNSLFQAPVESELRDRITIHDPITAAAYLNRGHVHFARAKMDLAIADYSEAIRILPGGKDAYAARSQAYLAQGKTDRAIDDAARSVKIDPKFPRGHIALGMAYQDAGRLKEAMDCAEKAVQLEPDNAEAYFRRGDFNRLLGNVEAALKDFSKANEIDPSFGSPYIGRGAISFDQKKYEEAVSYYTMALERDARMLQARKFRGYAYLGLGKDKEAKRDFAAVLAVAPQMREEIESASALMGRVLAADNANPTASKP